MKRVALSVTAIVVLALSINPASAQSQNKGGKPRPGGPAGWLIGAIDLDGDGAVSGEEFEKAAGKLKALDADKDGRLTADELYRRMTFGFFPPRHPD